MFLCDKCQKRYESLISHRNHVMKCQQNDKNIDNIAGKSVDNLDFVVNPEDLGEIINKIDAQINGLF